MNLQNIPSDESYRECFIASEGCKLITADYSGQETVVLANDSKDKNMLSFYKTGENDLHSYNAKMIFKDELKDLSLSEIKNKHPDLREKAKPVSFAIKLPNLKLLAYEVKCRINQQWLIKKWMNSGKPQQVMLVAILSQAYRVGRCRDYLSYSDIA